MIQQHSTSRLEVLRAPRIGIGALAIAMSLAFAAGALAVVLVASGIAPATVAGPVTAPVRAPGGTAHNPADFGAPPVGAAAGHRSRPRPRRHRAQSRRLRRSARRRSPGHRSRPRPRRHRDTIPPTSALRPSAQPRSPLPSAPGGAHNPGLRRSALGAARSPLPSAPGGPRTIPPTSALRPSAQPRSPLRVTDPNWSTNRIQRRRATKARRRSPR